MKPSLRVVDEEERDMTMTKNHAVAAHATHEPLVRAIPEDLRRKRSRIGYVVSHTKEEAEAEDAVRQLHREGFEPHDLVAVSDEIDQLRPYVGADAMEVPGPTSVARDAGFVAGLCTGAASGAVIALTTTFLSAGPPFALPVGVGALVGAVVGAIAGRWLGARLRRRPETFYDAALSGDEILVGVAIGKQPGRPVTETIGAAHRALTNAGLAPRLIEGEAAA